MYEVSQVGEDEFFHGEFDGVGRAWHGEEDASGDTSGVCAGEECGGADFVVGEESEEFTVAGEIDFEVGFGDIGGSIAGTDPGSAGDEDHVAFGVGDGFLDHATQEFGFIGYNITPEQGVSCGGEEIDDERATAIGF